MWPPPIRPQCVGIYYLLCSLGCEPKSQSGVYPIFDVCMEYLQRNGKDPSYHMESDNSENQMDWHWGRDFSGAFPLKNIPWDYSRDWAIAVVEVNGHGQREGDLCIPTVRCTGLRARPGFHRHSTRSLSVAATLGPPLGTQSRGPTRSRSQGCW